MAELSGNVIKRALDDIIQDDARADLIRLYDHLTRVYGELKNDGRKKRKILVKRGVIAKRLIHDKTAREFFETQEYLTWLEPYGVEPDIIQMEYLSALRPGRP